MASTRTQSTRTQSTTTQNPIDEATTAVPEPVEAPDLEPSLADPLDRSGRTRPASWATSTSSRHWPRSA